MPIAPTSVLDWREVPPFGFAQGRHCADDDKNDSCNESGCQG